MTPEEQWQPVEGFEDSYMISDCGRVYSKLSERLLNPIVLSSGYLAIDLCRDGSVKRRRVHQLVIEHFGTARPSAAHIPNHKDGVKSNNHYSNLEWMTQSENLKHAADIGLFDPALNLPQNVSGSNNGNSKLNEKDVVIIRSLFDSGFTKLTLSRMYCVSRRLIDKIIKRELWSNV